MVGGSAARAWSCDLERCFVKGRNLKLDNAKGVLMILVVIGHMLLPMQGTTRGVTNFFYVIYAFHMPAFVFISGLLAQRIYTHVPKAAGPAGNRAQRRRHREDGVGTGQRVASYHIDTSLVRTEGRFNWRRWCSTLWLYLLFQFMLFFSEIPAYGRTTRFPDFLHTSGAPWYLLALLLWYLMIPFFDAYRGKVLPVGLPFSDRHVHAGSSSISDERTQRDSRLNSGDGRHLCGIPYSLIAWFLLTIMSLAGGYIASGSLAGIGDFLALDRVIAFAPFFFAGYFIGPERLMNFLSTQQERTSVSEGGSIPVTSRRWSSKGGSKRLASRRRSSEGESNPVASGRRSSEGESNLVASCRQSLEKASKSADRNIVLILTVLGILCFVLIGTQSFDHLYPYKNVVYGAWYYRFHAAQNPAAFPGALASNLWLIRLVWFIISGLMSFALLALMPNRQLPLLTTIGQRTLQIYILHRPIRDLLLASGFITAAGPENSMHVLLLIILSLALTLVLSAGMFQRLFDTIQKLPNRLF